MITRRNFCVIIFRHLASVIKRETISSFRHHFSIDLLSTCPLLRTTQLYTIRSFKMARRFILCSAVFLALAHSATCRGPNPLQTWDQFLYTDFPLFPTEINHSFLKTGGLSTPDPTNQVNQVIIRELETLLNNPQISSTMYSNFLNAYEKDQDRENLAIFKENVVKIARQNILYHAGNSSWSEGIDFVTDMTEKEFYEYVGNGPNPEEISNFTTSGGHWTASKWFTNSSGAGVPDSKDWRDTGYVPPVKNQGSCGSCWAFATTAAVEIGVAIKTEGAAKPILSEQQLVDCFRKSCRGELPIKALKYIIENGLCQDSDYPYTSGSTGEAGECQKHPSAVIVSDYTKTRDEEEMKTKVAEIGPAAIGVYYGGGMAQQREGVYDGACGEKDGKPSGHHAMVIVGYGQEDGLDYWIIRNSHGLKRNNKGYLKLRRNTDKCGISSYLGALFPII